ncbi:MAG: GNAT family protein [Burkholderiales bacterium]|nr:GNAT family protein [Burkholderiales bacterium]
MPHTIRPFQPADWSSVWTLLQTTFASGDTYAYAPESSEAEIRAIWVDTPLATYVACADDGTVIGTYKLQPNQPGLGAHVCNCGYVVSPQVRGQGIASLMCEHSQAEALRLGFRAMQYNLVVSTNEGAVRLWQKLGFRIVGTLPGAFQHRQHGYVDAYVMFKQLLA